MKQHHAKAALAAAILVLALNAQTNRAVAQATRDSFTQRVDAIFAEWDHTNSPGCALGVIDDGEFIYRRGYGMANLEHDVPLSSTSVFYIASTSKQFVAASTILAAEQGYLSLDDDIRKYVPEIPDYGKTITIRHLLHHTSGIRDYLTLWELAGEEFADIHEPAEALEMIARQKALNFDPGDEYLYSNSGYFLLSVIIERATGRTLREFADENIFKPLGMEHTHFHDDHWEISKHRAIGHIERDGDIAMYVSNFDLVGSGGLHTSVDDLLLWDRNFYEDELGRGTLLEELQRRGVLNNGDTLTYAAGLAIDEYRGLKTVRHGGSAQGYKTELLRFPHQHFSVICLCNLGSIDPRGLANQVADVYLAAEFAAAAEQVATSEPAPVFVELPEQQLAAFNGVYRNPATGTIWKVEADGHQLKVEVNGFVFHLDALSATEFTAVNQPFELDARFEAPGADGLKHVYALVDGDSANYNEVELVTPTAAELAAFAGDYYSDELDATWTLEARGDSLFVVDGPEEPLAPTIEDEFKLQGARMDFSRDANGAVSGFEIDAGRVRGLRFVKIENG